MKRRYLSNGWEIKRLKRIQMRQLSEQSKNNIQTVAKMENIQNSLDEIQKSLTVAVKNLDDKIEKESDFQTTIWQNKISDLTDSMVQMLELVKILVANQLIDEIK